MKIVKVKWMDSTSQSGGWTDEDPKDMEPMKLMTVGFLLFEDEQRIVISHSIADNTDMRYAMFTIPKGMIYEYSEVEL